jgi:N-acylneuraminate cytidylyltransferase
MENFKPKSEVLAIVPARGGSKGIKRKNLIPFNGIPLLASSIEHALNSKLVTRVIVSTDDLEIREAALKYGAEVPFLRPAELAEDHVLDLPVFEHALQFLEKQGYRPEAVVHLRPTAPHRELGLIDAAISLLLDNPDADSVRSVSVPDKHPYRMFTIDGDGFLSAIMKHEHPVPYLLRRQDLPPVYYYNCVIDVTRPDVIYKKQSMTGDAIFPFIMKPEDVIDIDTNRDLEIARYLFERKL